MDHRFELFHQGPGLCDPSVRGLIFKMRRHACGRRGDHREHATELVRRLTQPRRVLGSEGIGHLGHWAWYISLEVLADLAQPLGIVIAGSEQDSRIEQMGASAAIRFGRRGDSLGG